MTVIKLWTAAQFEYFCISYILNILYMHKYVAMALQS